VSVLRSPRWRRRLAWTVGPLAVVGLAVGLGIKSSNTASDETQKAGAGEARQAYVYREPKRVQLTKRERARALATAANFVTHAVARRNVDDAYDLTHPTLRGGISRAEWHTGNIPVVPFPVQQARWKLEYSYEDDIGLQVLLFPTAGSGLRPEVFNMELAVKGIGAQRRFLVTSWAPTGVATQRPSGASAVGAGGTRDLTASLGGNSRLDQRWLLVPLVLFAVVPLLVIGYFVRGWLHGRKVASEYAASSPARELPTFRR
jgi:hypothetical protein